MKDEGRTNAEEKKADQRRSSAFVHPSSFILHPLLQAAYTASVCSAIMSQLKAASTAARPLRPIQRQRLWSDSSVPTPQLTESTLSSTCKPLTPCQTNSAGPPRLVLTTGLRAL